MKFVVVNHRTPLSAPACLHCSRPLLAGYLRDVSTQRPYCDYDCYRRDGTGRLIVSWFGATHAASAPATNHQASLGLMASLAAAACWGYAIPLSALSISLVQAALGMRELMTPDDALARRPG